MYFRKTIGHV